MTKRSPFPGDIIEENGLYSRTLDDDEYDVWNNHTPTPPNSPDRVTVGTVLAAADEIGTGSQEAYRKWLRSD